MSLTQIIQKTIYPQFQPSTDENGNNIINYPYSIEKASLNNGIISPTKTEIKLDVSDMVEIPIQIKQQLEAHNNVKPKWRSKMLKILYI